MRLMVDGKMPRNLRGSGSKTTVVVTRMPALRVSEVNWGVSVFLWVDEVPCQAQGKETFTTSITSNLRTSIYVRFERIVFI